MTPRLNGQRLRRLASIGLTGVRCLSCALVLCSGLRAGEGSGKPVLTAQADLTAPSRPLRPGGPAAQAQPNAPRGAETGGEGASTAAQLLQLQQEKDRRFREVQGQILELGRRWNGQGGGRAPLATAPESVPPPSDPNLPQRTSSAGTAPSRAGTSSGGEPESAPGGPADHPGATGGSPVAVVAEPASSVVLEGVIDHRGLADSLFATGQITAAARLYSGLDETQLAPDDRAWVRFQLAACDRRLGRLPAAQQRYREIVAAGEPEWLVQLARWWLRAIEDRERLAANSVRLRSLIEQLDVEVTNDIRNNAAATPGADAGVAR